KRTPTWSGGHRSHPAELGPRRRRRRRTGQIGLPKKPIRARLPTRTCSARGIEPAPLPISCRASLLLLGGGAVMRALVAISSLSGRPRSLPGWIAERWWLVFALALVTQTAPA